MYYCKDCGFEFDNPAIYYESFGLNSLPYKKIYICPNCKGTDFYEKTCTYCRCCGSKIINRVGDYCSKECFTKGQKMWKAEQKRRKILFDCPLSHIVYETEAYNKLNKTNYSYGQYVALIRPNLNNKKKEIFNGK